MATPKSASSADPGDLTAVIAPPSPAPSNRVDVPLADLITDNQVDGVAEVHAEDEEVDEDDEGDAEEDEAEEDDEEAEEDDEEVEQDEGDAEDDEEDAEQDDEDAEDDAEYAHAQAEEFLPVYRKVDGLPKYTEVLASRPATPSPRPSPPSSPPRKNQTMPFIPTFHIPSRAEARAVWEEFRAEDIEPMRRTQSNKSKNLIIQKGTQQCLCQQCKTAARPNGRLLTKEQMRSHLRHVSSQPDGPARSLEIDGDWYMEMDEAPSMQISPLSPPPTGLGLVSSSPSTSRRSSPPPPSSSESNTSLSEEEPPGAVDDVGVDAPSETNTSHRSDTNTSHGSDTNTSTVDATPLTLPLPSALQLGATFRSPSPDPMPVDEDPAAVFEDGEEPDQGISVDDLHIPVSASPLPYDFDQTTQEPWLCYLGVHASAAVRGIVLLLMHMHARYQLPHQACTVLATMLYTLLEYCFVLSSSTTTSPATAPPRTLRTMYKRMGIWDRFEVKTLCPKCWEPEDLEVEDIDADLCDDFGPADTQKRNQDWQRFCRRCEEPLYAEAAKSGYIRPRKQAPYDLFSLQLTECLAQPGFEDFCESYLDDTDIDGIYTRIQQGSVWRNMEAPDGTRFFPRSRAESLQQCRKVRVALLAAICDHPALCKLCGFGDQRHNTRPCTQCEISRVDMLSQGWKTEGVPVRDGHLHKRRAARMYDLQRSKMPGRKVEDYVKRYGCRWSELCRLPYFDPVTMGVLDPMHMLLQGLTKSLWFHTWVQGGKDKVKLLREGTEAGNKRELDVIHQALSTFEMPTSFARLPTKVGYPAGGSLTSDEWRALAVVYGPAVIPRVIIQAHEQMLQDASQKNPKSKRQAPPEQFAEGLQPSEDEAQASPPPRTRVHRDAAQNYLKFATVMKIYMRREISERDIERASRVYLDFFEEFVKIRRYGPVHGFWTFLFERLNKVLKAINTSGHKGGVVEVTFAREFKREMSLTRMCSVLANQDNDRLARFFASNLQKHARDIARIGTLSALAAEAQEDAAAQREDRQPRQCVPAGPGKVQFLEDGLQRAVMDLYTRHYPDLKLRFGADATAPLGSVFLANRATFFSELRVEGQRITTAHEDKRSKSDSLILHRVSTGLQWVGELRSVFSHRQSGIEQIHTFAEVAWLQPLQDTPKHADMYREFPELEVNFWEHRRYLKAGDWEPDPLILVKDIAGTAARCEMESEHGKIWITTGMSKSGRSL
ncbi:hypothetical protein CALCODRAFT_488967 [Calocera cornea HHB12733]|uniref:Uncharacterized protein n=1 Tax=Calocera cornea HHB12733 TaxID=1353952 RepID=A0A165C192_9BASI|nr:hypothetical protein CALCODRAFT_488967 [Calocera cornea HHB12733]